MLVAMFNGEFITDFTKGTSIYQPHKVINSSLWVLNELNDLRLLGGDLGKNMLDISNSKVIQIKYVDATTCGLGSQVVISTN
jgi:hypothetical protein